MKTIILIILITILDSCSSSDLEEFKLPYHQKDFISKNKIYGKQKGLPILIFGTQRDYPGVNYEVKENAPALAIKSGKIEDVNTSKSYGDFVIVNHKNGITARYFHLKNTQLEIGDAVKSGDIIGVSSDIGLTTVNSIGLEIKLNGKRINPDSIFKPK